MSRERTITWEDPLEIVRGAEGRTGLELMRAIATGELPPPPITQTIGMGLVEVGEGRCAFTMEPGEHLYNPIGLVHGGAAATLLDSVTGCAVHTTLPAGVGYSTLELKVNYVAPIRSDSGTITAVGEVLHRGGRTATAQARATDASGRLVAHGTCTCLILGG